MAKKTARKPRGPKAKQGYLSGEGEDMTPPHHKDIDAAADNYWDTMQDRVKLSSEEKQAKTNLIEKMKTHQLERYEMPDGTLVMVTSNSNVKVRKKHQKQEEE